MWSLTLSAPVDTAETGLKTETQQMSDTLIKTPGQNTQGQPQWDPEQEDEIMYPGLNAQDEPTHIVSTNKIDQLDELGAETTTDKFNLPNIYMEIDIDEGATTYEIGDETDMDEAETIIPVNREAVTPDGDPVEIKIRSYEKQ